MKLSVIVPVLNEAAALGPCLARLERTRRLGHEIIFVDGGSRDATVARCREVSDTVLTAGAGRALQSNTGAAAASGEVLVFLHADTLLPDGAEQAVAAAMTGDAVVWGRFDVRLSGADWRLRVVEWMMNARSRWTGIATGDQAIFVARALFDELA